MRDSKKRQALFALSSVFVLLLPIARVVSAKLHNLHLQDFGSYCAVPRALFSGQDPLPAWNPNCHGIFPLTAVFAIALAVWSLHLYRRVEHPYMFELTPHSERRGE